MDQNEQIKAVLRIRNRIRRAKMTHKNLDPDRYSAKMLDSDQDSINTDPHHWPLSEFFFCPEVGHGQPWVRQGCTHWLSCGSWTAWQRRQARGKRNMSVSNVVSSCQSIAIMREHLNHNTIDKSRLAPPWGIWFILESKMHQISLGIKKVVI